jgi:hypothetical protein
MFRGQGGLQLFLVLIAFLAVPCMLLPKPLILKKRHEQRTQASASYGLLSPDDNAFRFQRYSGGWRAVVWPAARCGLVVHAVVALCASSAAGLAPPLP